MKTYSEVGHAKNISNFEDLISYCTAYGAAYNPVLSAIKISNMNALKNNANTIIANVSTTFTAFKVATNNREIVFLPLKKLATRIMSSLRSCGVNEQTIKDALTINRKLQGKRAKSIAAESNASETREAVPSETPVDLPSHISVSQQSYDSRIEFFAKLIDLLIATPAYNPNEPDLKIAALNTVLANMKASNAVVVSATTNFSNARIARSKSLYAPVTGLVDVAIECKEYVKSVFGATSYEYKQVSGIRFKTQK